MYKFYPYPFEGCVNIESILDSLQKIKGYLKHWNTMYMYIISKLHTLETCNICIF